MRIRIAPFAEAFVQRKRGSIFHRPISLIVFTDQSGSSCPLAIPATANQQIADLLAGILSRIGFDEPTAQEAEDTSKLVKKLAKLRPDLATKMFSVGPVARKRAFRRYREQGLDAPGEYKAIAISGEMFQYLNLFAHKAVLWHYFNTAKQPLPRQGGVLSFPRPKELVAMGALPPELLNLLGPVTAISQGRRMHREYEFRESYGPTDGVYAVACRFRKGVFVFGLAVENIQTLNDKTRQGFLSPSSLLSILSDDRYKWYDQFGKDSQTAAA